MFQRILVYASVLIVFLILTGWLAGTLNWYLASSRLKTALVAQQSVREPQSYDLVREAEVFGLPDPVYRYFRAVLPESGYRLTAAEIRHNGEFNMGTTDDRWKRFDSVQHVVTHSPGFLWNARIRIAPFMPARVHDAYIGREGILRASLLGLIPVAGMRDREELARGELMRFLAEAFWYPTALLPGNGLRWEAMDERSSRLVLKDGMNEVSLTVNFNADNLVETVYAKARGRTINGKTVPTPWKGRFWNYQEFQGMLIPVEGEVSWLLPDGAKPYWRGKIMAIRYNELE